jgi:hypothetical protein
MKNILAIIFILVALGYGQSKVRVISGATNTELRLLPDGTVYTSNTSTAVMKVSNITRVTADGILITSNIAVVNASVVASNLTVNSVISNIVPVGVTNVGQFYVVLTNASAFTQGGAIYVMATNNVQTTTAITSIPSLNVTNAVSVTPTDNKINVTNRVGAMVYDTNGNGLDFHEGSVVVTTITHRKQGNGDQYSAYYEWFSLANSGAISMAILITNYSLQISGAVSVEGKGWLRAYELPAAPTNFTTTLIPYNINRVYGTNGLAVVRGINTISLITNYGTQLLGTFVPGGSGAQSVGTIGQADEVWKLKTNTWYVLQFSNTSGSAKDGSMSLNWYREYP